MSENINYGHFSGGIPSDFKNYFSTILYKIG